MEENANLEEMREQLSILKQKLNNEQIINERLLRESCRSKASTFRHSIILTVVSAVFVIIMVFVSFRPLLGFSWPFCIATIVMMIFCVFMTYWDHRNVGEDSFNGDLLTAAQNVRDLRRRYQKWLYVAIPMIIVWYSWMVWEMWGICPDRITFYIMVISTFIGGVVGGIIGNVMRRKVIRVCNDIISQIEAQ